MRLSGTAFFKVMALLPLLVPFNGATQVLEEVVVTAQKREQNIQDVGIAVTAFSGEQLEQLGVTNTTEITQQSPGLQLFTYTPSLIVFNIRGVSQNNFIDTLEAPVAVYMDEAYVASLNGLGQQLFDMERVEVLRGPQGTLFGRNATGGVIHYLTNAPDENELNGYIKGGKANTATTSLKGRWAAPSRRISAPGWRAASKKPTATRNPSLKGCATPTARTASPSAPPRNSM